MRPSPTGVGPASLSRDVIKDDAGDGGVEACARQVAGHLVKDACLDPADYQEPKLASWELVEEEPARFGSMW